MSLPELTPDLLTSPRVQAAMEDFIIECLDEANDMLATGDTTTKTALIKMVLAGALKARGDSGANAEDVLAKARETVAGILD